MKAMDVARKPPTSSTRPAVVEIPCAETACGCIASLNAGWRVGVGSPKNMPDGPTHS